ncbi:DNA-directed RNA polymerase subunit alpha [Acholeplasma oculi]|uniref:DNA-directed RNA polymerase subunit alpha n=1 Tax=Acholeplasma oculi TaxID=35623 RepID=A0A061AIG4_9MOLU|nr:DNA-directed RNA polymerase subunit alpha [Acholeplasma oculi]CDR31416.1 DNA-directed RNA polymerase subunit alpha [Acholeplasma oculi]SKC39856.1 DNA-directed RNA polymerase subunit alpha [Acholeplasma oculi]SUT91960.1 DNA-directed RNA polymerase subunit alpha [Acholeplasma oculi]
MKDLKFEKPTSVEEISEEGKIGRFLVRPLERGYGITLGNALRRVLLSSLPGAAIVNVKIDGVEHEFSTISGVYEDVMGIVLNLKKVVFSVDSQDPHYEQKLELYAEGPTTVTAGDFNLVEGLEVINKDQVIATLAEGAKLNMIVTVRRGIGYVPADQNKQYSKYELNVIPIDALYTPVERVIYNVEKTRGDLDELTIEIETNGSILAKEALALASKMLVDYFQVMVSLSEDAGNYDFIREVEEEPASKKSDTKIEQLDLSVRLFNSLKRSGITTVGELMKLSEEEVMRLRSLGRKSFKELKEKLAEHGLEFEHSSSKDGRFDLESDEDKE